MYFHVVYGGGRRRYGGAGETVQKDTHFKLHNGPIVHKE